MMNRRGEKCARKLRKRNIWNIDIHGEALLVAEFCKVETSKHEESFVAR
jgi:hypothetical protein